jgi:hypothetical protein
VGIDGLKKILFNAFNRCLEQQEFKAFDNAEDAKEYLIKD